MEKQLVEYLESINFVDLGVQKCCSLIPTYYRTEDGDHFIISAIHVCTFGGVDTPEGGLGCVTFSYHGKLRYKHCRTVIDRPEMLKKVFRPKSADEAIQAYKDWSRQCQEFIKARWKKVL